MGGSISSGRNNDELIDNLIEADYLKSPYLQQVFRAVDRGDYYSKGDRTTAYRDSAYRHGNLHLSAPCIYSEVMEALKLKSGLTFLNLGSGSGYLSTVAGLILGRYGVNHGIELCGDVVDFAYHRLEEFLMQSEAVDAYEFCEPRFMVGNCLKLDNCNMQLYDRVYCGAACPQEHEAYMKSLIKVGGILVMPVNNRLLQITRTGESSWSECKVLSVSFAPLNCPEDKESIGFLKLPDMSPPCLKEICRSKVRTVLRQIIDAEHPTLKKKKSLPYKIASRRQVRRIVIPIVDESETGSDNSQNNSDDDDDEDNHSSGSAIKYSISTRRVPSGTTTFIESFMRCQANLVDEVVAGPSNWRGKGTVESGGDGTDKSTSTKNETVQCSDEPKTEVEVISEIDLNAEAESKPDIDMNQQESDSKTDMDLNSGAESKTDMDLNSGAESKTGVESKTETNAQRSGLKTQEAESQTEVTVGVSPEDSGISDSDMNTDDDKSGSSESENSCNDHADTKPKEQQRDTKNFRAKSAGSSSGKKSRRKRQHSGSEQRNVKSRKRGASYPRLKLRHTTTVGYIWKRIPSEWNSDSEKEGKPEEKEKKAASPEKKPESANEPNYSVLMAEKIKSLPLPRSLLSYVNYSRREN